MNKGNSIMTLFSQQVKKLCKSVAIFELSDLRVYLGCSQKELQGYLQTFNIFYLFDKLEVRQPKYLKEFEAEIRILGMQRYSSENALNLDYLVESNQGKDFGCNYEEYQYYTTAYIPRW
jgi:hypothetical protein